MTDKPLRRRKLSDAERYPAPGMQRCLYCERDLPFDHFGADRNMKSGRDARCLECVRSYMRARHHLYKDGGKLTWRKRHLERTYGLTEDEYNALLTAQNGVCAICCGVPKGRRSLVVDHDHKTGKVRGLLCSPCNTGLGGFRDSRMRMRTAIAYLEKYSDDGIEYF